MAARDHSANPAGPASWGRPKGCKTVIKGEMWKTARHISGGVFIQLSELRLLFPELENFVLFQFFFCGLRQEPLATLKEQPRRGRDGMWPGASLDGPVPSAPSFNLTHSTPMWWNQSSSGNSILSIWSLWVWSLFLWSPSLPANCTLGWFPSPDVHQRPREVGESACRCF